MNRSSFEVVVLGGGPAGFAAASLLSRRGHEVALVRPASPPAAPLAQSIPPSAGKLLDELGARSAIDRAGFVPNEGNTVWWAGGAVRSERFSAESSGWHVDRGRLEAALTGAALATGVSVLTGNARAAERGGARPAWRVAFEPAADEPYHLTADWVLDATGRHGLLARRWREPDRSTITLALVRHYRQPGGWPREIGTHTLIESYANGWAWSVPVSRDVRCVTVMVDHRVSDLTGEDLGALIDGELANAPEIAAGLKGAEPVGDGWACPASLYTSTRFGEPGMLVVGDAASCIDPLSSYGVKKALASGWLAAVATHTALIDAPMTDEAVAFFDARERAVYESYRRLSATYFEEAAGVYDTPYWRTRADAARAAGRGTAGRGAAGDAAARASSVVAELDEMAIGGDDAIPEAMVRAAFEAIKARPIIDAVPGRTLHVAERAAIEGHRIVRAEHHASDSCPGGLRFIRGVSVAELVLQAGRHSDVAELWSAYNAAAAPVSLPDFVTALSTAFAAGFLQHRDEPTGSRRDPS